MEFFKIVELDVSEDQLQNKLRLQDIEELCCSIFPLEEGYSECQIGSNWGEFQLRRDAVKGGVRFSMLDCPNALAWTITAGYPPKEKGVVIHATINRIEKDREFVDELQSLISEMVDGLHVLFGENS